MERTWEKFFEEEKQKEFMHRLHNFLALEYRSHTVYPRRIYCSMPLI